MLTQFTDAYMRHWGGGGVLIPGTFLSESFYSLPVIVYIATKSSVKNMNKSMKWITKENIT